MSDVESDCGTPGLCGKQLIVPVCFPGPIFQRGVGPPGFLNIYLLCLVQIFFNFRKRRPKLPSVGKKKFSYGKKGMAAVNR